MSSTISYFYYLFVSFFSNFNDLFVVANASRLTKRMLTASQTVSVKHLDNKRPHLKPANGEIRSSKGHPL